VYLASPDVLTLGCQWCHWAGLPLAVPRLLLVYSVGTTYSLNDLRAYWKQQGFRTNVLVPECSKVDLFLGTFFVFLEKRFGKVCFFLCSFTNFASFFENLH
jgi:hypothetical protein